jgi:VWFA-related protein
MESRTAARPSRAAAALLALTALLAAAGAGARQEGESEPPATPAGGRFGEVLDVAVVDVDVVVTDGAGRKVSGLERESFVLRVDGEVVPISNFYTETSGTAREAPRRIETGRDSGFVPADQVAPAEQRTHVVVLVDHTRLGAANRKRAFAALRETLGQFDDDDLVSVVGIEGSLVVYSDFLFDRAATSRILDEVQRVGVRPQTMEAERRQLFGELARGQSGGILARTAGASREAETVLPRLQAYAAQEHARSVESLRQIEAVAGTLAGLPGRKVLLYVGEGIPTRPGEDIWVEYRNRFGAASDIGLGLRHEDLDTDYERAVGRYDLSRAADQAALAANRADVALYAIDAESSHGAEIRSALTEQGATSETISVIDANFREPLEAATQATGGRLLQMSGTLADRLVDLVRDFDTFYSLGFVQPGEWEPGSLHTIEVALADPRRGWTVRHRRHVRVPGEEEREAGAAVATLMYHSVDNPLAVRAHPGDERPGPDGARVLPVTLEIPVEHLTLVPREGFHALAVTLYVATKDAAGNPGKVQKVPFHLDIPDDKVDDARGEAAHHVLPLIVRAGDQQVAIVVRDDPSGVLSAVRLDL